LLTNHLDLKLPLSVSERSEAHVDVHVDVHVDLHVHVHVHVHVDFDVLLGALNQHSSMS